LTLSPASLGRVYELEVRPKFISLAIIFCQVSTGSHVQAMFGLDPIQQLQVLTPMARGGSTPTPPSRWSVLAGALPRPTR
jgi:hypothetical protein